MTLRPRGKSWMLRYTKEFVWKKALHGYRIHIIECTPTSLVWRYR
jgi:hypothetical protein